METVEKTELGGQPCYRVKIVWTSGREAFECFSAELPLEIVHEQWYSPELQMVVLLKHNDPRFGETTFRLTNITRGDPTPDLFAEPQGYRTVDQHEPVFGRPVMRRP